ncbi:MAG TPA: insulinase family protein, partial [Bacteroidales bacterium]|nr:insulinase family protein [Bacteroidales bacterium]
MKKFVSVLLFLTLLLSTGFAQETDLNQPLPVDEKVRIGKLENGFTYYIRQNNKPENRIEMRLAVNAGSLQETDEQQGLAHLLEHMAFNGTKHFEKNDIIEYLQSIGVRFGPDLNAYTFFDETVYMLTIPSDSAELVDKGFLIMEDWAFNQTLDGNEIDKERGVVIEEWRLGQGPMQRLRDKTLPVLFHESRYAERLPIGKKEVIENFDHQVLRDFYNDWYRPNLMALVVVGDIDPDEAEDKIKKHFSQQKNPENEKERVDYAIPNHDETLVVVATDKEAPYTFVQLVYKMD